MAYRFAALCLLSRGAVCKSMYRICEKGILHNPPRFLCDFHRAATKGWPQNESCAILFSAPGISVSDPETTPNLWKQKPVLPGRSFPITKVEFIRVITKQKSAISPPRKKVYISSFYDWKTHLLCLNMQSNGFFVLLASVSAISPDKPGFGTVCVIIRSGLLRLSLCFSVE